MMASLIEYEPDVFLWLETPTIANMRSVLEWANERALKTYISFLDASRSFRRQPSDKKFEEVMCHINRRAKPYFRVILRKNLNWFLLLSDKKHIEDTIEIGTSGIIINGMDHFIHCYLKKEWLRQLRRRFRFKEQ